MAFLLNFVSSTITKSVLNQFKTEMMYLGKNTRSITSRVNNKIDKPTVTIQEVKEKLAHIMGVGKDFRIVRKSRSYLSEYLPKSQAELEPRSMQDSFSSALIPLSTDAELQDKYVTFLGRVRLGRLLEDMDIFAAWVVQNHIKNPKLKKGIPSPYTLVTVLVDEIDFTDTELTHTEDIRLSGHVSWVGTSSVEIVVWLEQMRNNKWNQLTRALFLMAARNPTNTGSAIINPIKPANEEEETIFSGGEARKKRRYERQSQSLMKVIPTEDEQKIIHDLYIRSMPKDEYSMSKRTLPTGCVWMENCTLSNIIYSQPENRNLHNKVFGGFIMRQAVELSWAASYLFTHYRPDLKHISDINFHHPIDVSSLIRMTAYLVYTQAQFVQVTLYAECFEPQTGKRNTSNVLHFTLQLPDIALEVFPRTYHEAMMYIDGRRHFLATVNQKVAHSKLTSKP